MKSIKISIILLFTIFIQCKSKITSNESPSINQTKTSNESLNLNDYWIEYHRESISSKGKRVSKHFNNTLVIYNFDNSTVKKIASPASYDSTKTMYNLKYNLNSDTLFIEGRRHSLINNFDSNFVEIEDYKNKTISHYLYKLKRIKQYNQFKFKQEVSEFIDQGSIQIIDKSRIECKINTRYEFSKNGYYFHLNDCEPKQISWLHGQWNLSQGSIPSELFLTFSHSKDSPIQIKDVGEDHITGIRFGDQETKVVIKKSSIRYDSEQIKGNWTNTNSKSRDIKKVNFDNKSIELVYQDSDRKIFDINYSKNGEIIFFNSQDQNEYSIRIIDQKLNRIELILRKFSTKSYWKSLTLTKNDL